MKITIDPDKLLHEGKITQAEYDKFSQFAAHDTATLVFNILIGFGVIAVSGAALALTPTPSIAVFLGLVVCAAGIVLIRTRYKQWLMLANICVLVGSLLFGGGVIKATEGSAGSFLLIGAVFAGSIIGSVPNKKRSRVDRMDDRKGISLESFRLLGIIVFQRH